MVGGPTIVRYLLKWGRIMRISAFFRYLILSREIFNPNYALFTAAADGATFQPNPLSMINNNHLDYFKFVGRIIGKAICDEQLMDAHFTRWIRIQLS